MNRREQLAAKIEDLFLYFQSSMVSNFDARELHYQGVDSCQFNLIEETNRGSIYFQPMSQERLNTLDERADFKELPFDEDGGWPTEDDALLVHRAIFERLYHYNVGMEGDLRSVYEFTSWEPIGSVHL
jgi:hypothetical protein